MSGLSSSRAGRGGGRARVDHAELRGGGHGEALTVTGIGIGATALGAAYIVGQSPSGFP